MYLNWKNHLYFGGSHSDGSQNMFDHKNILVFLKVDILKLQPSKHIPFRERSLKVLWEPSQNVS